jgi:hypothetical protein
LAHGVLEGVAANVAKGGGRHSGFTFKGRGRD